MNDYIITYTLLPAEYCKQILFESCDNAEQALQFFKEEVKAPKGQRIKVNSVEIG
jgi:hypothetical protein